LLRTGLFVPTDHETSALQAPLVERCPLQSRPRAELVNGRIARPAHSIGLDAARGLAAILVLVHHVRGVFLVDYATLAHPSAVVTAIYLLTSLGHRAVVVFFVLSGYLIGSNVLHLSLDRRWRWFPYLVRRLTRLWVVLLPALILAVAWDQLGQHLTGNSIYHGHLAHESVISFDISLRGSVIALLGNVLFLQGILVPPFGSDSPLWSLSYEFWYYLLFPLFLVALVSSMSGRRRMACIALGASILVLVGPTIDVYFLLWLLGAGVGFGLGRRPDVATNVLFRAGLAVGALSLLALSFIPGFRTSLTGDVLWAFATAALIILMQSGRAARHQHTQLYRITATAIASCSYTLYLVHLPLLTFIRSVATPLQRWQPSFASLLTCLLIAVAVFVYAYVVGQLTERNTTKVRKWIESALSTRIPRVALTTQPRPLESPTRTE
jgi:peptidoglycan/LPS O-acetylase OafA/YrhL